MRAAHLLLPTAALCTAVLLGGCGSDTAATGATGSPAPSASGSAAPSSTAAAASTATLQYDVTQPPTTNVLKIAVKSATRAGQTITLTLTGTYTGSSFTSWQATTVDAPGCTVTPTNAFPSGSFTHGQSVTGTWTLACSGTGPVDVAVDPFGGLVSGDTTTRITLH
jgi:hypothetical protein